MLAGDDGAVSCFCPQPIMKAAAVHMATATTVFTVFIYALLYFILLV
jgi:hypothetical protein